MRPVPQVMEPMQLQFGYMLFSDQRIRHLFPDAAQEHFIAYGEVEMHVSVGIDAAGALHLTLQMRGVRVFHAAELGPNSLMMRYGPLRLVNWLSWLTDNVVAAAQLPWGKAPGSYWPVPVFLGPEFEDDHGVFGLDHDQFHLMAVSFINGMKKAKATRRVPYVARLEMEHPDSRPARVLGASAGELTVRRTRYNPSRYEYQSYEETVPAFNADAIGVTLDRLQETGQAVGDYPKVPERAIMLGDAGATCEPGTVPFQRLVLERQACARIKVSSPEEVADMVREQIGDTAQEHCGVVAVNSSNEAIGVTQVSIGGLADTVVDPRVIFAPLLAMGAVAFVLYHNHPSGSLEPSEADVTLTRKLREGAKLLSLTMLDHVIVTHNGFTSMQMRGMLR